MIQKSTTYLEASAEMAQMLNFEHALLLTLCTVTVVWPETSVPSQTAPVRREPSNCQCSATTTRTSAACVSRTYVYVCVCARACTSVYSRTCDRPLSPSSSLTGFPRLWPAKCGSQGRNQTAEQWRASFT